MDKITINQTEIDKLKKDAAVAQQMRPAAEAVLGRARSKAPSWLEAEWFVKAGVGPRGAFAQAVARGSGATLAEFGGARSQAYAYMRSSIR